MNIPSGADFDLTRRAVLIPVGESRAVCFVLMQLRSFELQVNDTGNPLRLQKQAWYDNMLLDRGIITHRVPRRLPHV